DAGIPVVVVSNNKYERVKRAVEKFGIEFEAFALKPFTFGINRALKRFDVQPHEVVMIGDQLMTDIRAAKRAGLKSVLVKPLLKTDSINTQINRWRERRTMKKIIAKYETID
ncbi:HAD-IIIA family hydrolase, partial [Streptococcus suis]|uniref:YqeG family HAD IIIA-type phosphatase n=1 Tax=Streptococcus suis TaxID=1307 RepID=UPI0012903FF6